MLTSLIHLVCNSLIYSFFSNYPTSTQIYPLSLHDALPISISCAAWYCRRRCSSSALAWVNCALRSPLSSRMTISPASTRSEEHTSELQSRFDIVCRLLLEKKKNSQYKTTSLHDFTYN